MLNLIKKVMQTFAVFSYKDESDCFEYLWQHTAHDVDDEKMNLHRVQINVIEASYSYCIHLSL